MVHLDLHHFLPACPLQPWAGETLCLLDLTFLYLRLSFPACPLQLWAGETFCFLDKAMLIITWAFCKAHV